jgi:hypothetical protein
MSNSNDWLESWVELPGVGRVVFTRKQARGALPNGTLVEKCNSRPLDDHQDGSRGTIVGSLGRESGLMGSYAGHFYFVEWEDHPCIPLGIADYRIRRVDPS